MTKHACIMVSVYYNDQCFFNANHISLLFSETKTVFINWNEKTKTKWILTVYSNSIMALTYLLNIPGRAMFFGILKAHILKLKLTVYSLWTRKRNHADIHAHTKKLTHEITQTYTHKKKKTYPCIPCDIHILIRHLRVHLYCCLGNRLWQWRAGWLVWSMEDSGYVA